MNGELYVSSLYQRMIETNRKIFSYSTSHFAQLGTPEDYSDTIHWINCAKFSLRQQRQSKRFHAKKEIECNFLMLISGEGSRFVQGGYSTHKAFLKYGEDTVFENIIKSLPKFQEYIFAVSKTNLQLKKLIADACAHIGIEYIFIDIDTPNSGQADSFKQALNQIISIPSINTDLPLYISSCDSIITIDSFQEILEAGKDLVVLSKTNPYARFKYDSFSYAVCESNKVPESEQIERVKRLSIKSLPLYNSPDNLKFITGSFFFSTTDRANNLINALYKRITPVNSELYVDSLFELLIEIYPETTLGLDVAIYNSLGTPDEYETGLYWLRFLEILADS